MLLDMSRRAWLKSKRNNGVVPATLRLYIGKAAPAKRLDSRYVGGGNLDVKMIATTIGLIVVQGLI
jgi:hypothetical protein